MTHVNATELSYDMFIQLHQNQLNSSRVGTHFWKTLYHKLIHEQFDAGNTFKIEMIEYVNENGNENDENDDENDENDENANENDDSFRVISLNADGIKCDDSTHIYLIDHMWTYRINDAKTHLQTIDGLCERLTNLMGIKVTDDMSKDSVISIIIKEMWKLNQCYTIDTHDADTSLPVWYIMDEFGSRIQHSNDPSFRCVPFYYIPTRVAYSLLFPIKDVSFGAEVTRNYIESHVSIGSNDFEENENLIDALLIPWKYCDLTHINCNQIEPDVEFVRSGRIEESLPNVHSREPIIPNDRKIKVFTQYKYVRDYLISDAFEITDSLNDADILWLNDHYKHYHELSINKPNVFINQFPFEHILTVKDLFAIICRRYKTDAHNDNINIDPNTLRSLPEWISTTFNLQYELPQFVSYYQKRAEMNLDNVWICKPWNLARGLDTTITDDLNCIIRLRNNIPKVVCKYITDPVLFMRDDLNNALVKFDIRYIILLQSVSPLKLFVYKKFWLRFSNKPFSLSDFDDYEKHFTVMNYSGDGIELKQMECDDFVEAFDKQYAPNYKWRDSEQMIFTALRNVFECATMKPPPNGIGPNKQSRAMYAADIMLRWDSSMINGKMTKTIEPVILEINYGPDCERACQYYNHFFNDIFSVLFLNDTSNQNVILI